MINLITLLGPKGELGHNMKQSDKLLEGERSTIL